jgi:hypothetical protein
MDKAERRVRLIQRLEIIFNDVQDLLLDDHIFWELQKIVQKNPRFKEAPGLFTQWMASAFVQATAVGVHRQAKASDDIVSLRRFLHEVQKYPWLVSREHYMSFYAGRDTWLIESGQRHFDRLAGEGGLHIPIAVVEEHLHELTQTVGAIEHYVDRRIAHYDKRGLAQPMPTFADLTASLKTLEEIIIFYWPLLQGSGMTTMLPAIQFDWDEIFQFPWSPLPYENASEVI